MLYYQPKGKKTVANFIHYIFLFNHWKKKIDNREVICFSFTIFWKKKIKGVIADFSFTILPHSDIINPWLFYGHVKHKLSLIYTHRQVAYRVFVASK